MRLTPDRPPSGPPAARARRRIADRMQPPASPCARSRSRRAPRCVAHLVLEQLRDAEEHLGRLLLRRGAVNPRRRFSEREVLCPNVSTGHGHPCPLPCALRLSPGSITHLSEGLSLVEQVEQLGNDLRERGGPPRVSKMAYASQLALRHALDAAAEPPLHRVLGTIRTCWQRLGSMCASLKQRASCSTAPFSVP